MLLPKDRVNSIVQGVKDTVSEALNSKRPPNELLTVGLTVDEFKKMHGWYGSSMVMWHIVGAYCGRLGKTYVESTGDLDGAFAFLNDVQSQGDAVKILQSDFTKRHGEVDAERVKELDLIGEAWELQSKELLERLKGQAIDSDIRGFES